MCDTSNALVRKLVIWDHTVLPATRQVILTPLPDMMLILIYRSWKDERLSWPRWQVIPKCAMFTQRRHPSKY